MTRLKIAIILVLLAAVGMVGWHAGKLSGPSYKGKTLRVWLREYAESRRLGTASGSIAFNDQAKEAIRQIGTNAIPTLLRLVRATDSKLEFQLMDWLRRHHVNEGYRPAPFWNEAAMYAFELLGSNAQGAVPELAKIANENISPASQQAAVYSLRWIGPPTGDVVPSLLHWAASTDPFVQFVAIESLGDIGPAAKSAVPLLLKLATGTNSALRAAARWSLPQIDPEAAAKAGITNAPWTLEY